MRMYSTLSKRQILDSSKLEEFADDNFEFNENGEKVRCRGRKKRCEKSRNCSFSHRVFKRHVQQTRTNKGLFGKGLCV